MSDLIDRQAVIDMLAAMQGRCTSKAALIQNSKIWQQVKDLPSAQPMSKRGKWITKSTNGEMFDVCSECGYVEWDKPNKFCPNCGADMRGDNNV